MSTGQRKRRQQNQQHPMDSQESESFMRSAVTQSQGMVTHHPMSSAMVAFGIGLGVGVAVGSLLCGSSEPPPSFGKRAELAAERIGRQVLDAITGSLPHSIARHVA